MNLNKLSYRIKQGTHKMALEFITSLFKNKSKKGVDYLVGNTMDGKYKYLVFRNTKKEADNQQDYHLYRSLNEEFEPLIQVIITINLRPTGGKS